MPDFTSEDDLSTFEGWLKYQVGDTVLSSDELETWRGVYEECQPASPVGLMRWPRFFEQNFRVAKWGRRPGVKLPCGAAAGRSRPDRGCVRQGLHEVALCYRRRCIDRSIVVPRRRLHRHADRLPHI